MALKASPFARTRGSHPAAAPRPPWQMDFGLPSFIANHTSSNWMVRNILKLESAYKSMYLAAGATK